jgi:hypothetical protein
VKSAARGEEDEEEDGDVELDPSPDTFLAKGVCIDLLPKGGELNDSGPTHVGAYPIDNLSNRYGGQGGLDAAKLLHAYALAKNRVDQIDSTLSAAGTTEKLSKPLRDERGTLKQVLADKEPMIKQAGLWDQVRDPTPWEETKQAGLRAFQGEEESALHLNECLARNMLRVAGPGLDVKLMAASTSGPAGELARKNLTQYQGVIDYLQRENAQFFKGLQQEAKSWNLELPEQIIDKADQNLAVGGVAPTVGSMIPIAVAAAMGLVLLLLRTTKPSLKPPEEEPPAAGLPAPKGPEPTSGGGLSPEIEVQTPEEEAAQEAHDKELREQGARERAQAAAAPVAEKAPVEPVPAPEAPVVPKAEEKPAAPTEQPAAVPVEEKPVSQPAQQPTGETSNAVSQGIQPTVNKLPFLPALGSGWKKIGVNRDRTETMAVWGLRVFTVFAIVAMVNAGQYWAALGGVVVLFGFCLC